MNGRELLFCMLIVSMILVFLGLLVSSVVFFVIGVAGVVFFGGGIEGWF